MEEQTKRRVQDKKIMQGSHGFFHGITTEKQQTPATKRETQKGKALFKYEMNGNTQGRPWLGPWYCQCCHSLRRMPPFGRARKNGKNHDDWLPERTMHKSCWVKWKKMLKLVASSSYRQRTLQECWCK
eukprot:TRINITY_DN9_c0_g1_i2.p2 TRINITY_DN9_c0_g1~~TRINITY_DN9_c0_g1_i2.p2  ORF type:complete len:128 (+),score=24.22 TRINITY_DN9_c0_g1_i2:306-689(+)